MAQLTAGAAGCAVAGTYGDGALSGRDERSSVAAVVCSPHSLTPNTGSLTTGTAELMSGYEVWVRAERARSGET